MIHTFSFKEDYFVLDTESGSIHELNRPAFDVLTCMENGFDPCKELKSVYGFDEISEVLDDIETLNKEGLLFSECTYDTEKPVFNDPVIKSLCLNVAHDCNLRCGYCFGDKGFFFGERALMSESTAKKALDFLIKSSGGRKHLEVDFFGGEPLINFGTVRAAVLYGRELEKKTGKAIRFTLTTNAYHVTEEMENFINKEMKNLVISIDGRKETHDRYRKNAKGKGSYDKTLKNAKMLLQKRTGEYYVRGTFTKYNPDFSSDARALIDMGFESVSLEPVVTGKGMAITKKDLPAILKEYERLAELYEERKKEGRGFSFFHFTIDLDSGPCLNKRLKGCGAGSEYTAVSPDGSLYPCHQFVGKEDFYMGDIERGIINTKIRQKFMDNHVFKKEECFNCWAKYYCSGGCAANSFNINKNLMQPYEIGCIMEKKRIELAIALSAREERIKHEADGFGINART